MQAKKVANQAEEQANQTEDPAGDKELRKIFEETTTQNVKAVVAYSTDTRKVVRELEEKVRSLDGLVRQYDQRFAEVTKQLAALQTKVYAGGS